MNVQFLMRVKIILLSPAKLGSSLNSQSTDLEAGMTSATHCRHFLNV